MDAIVGREAELEAAERFLDALPESPCALVVEGEAGIGKTTVWEAAVRSAEARGYRVLRARPAESEAKLSYAALADLVGDVFDEVRDALPAPQERALAVAILRADADEDADARTTATALVGVLGALAAGRPVLVAIDDVQWLDPASARALAFAARRLPERVGLLVTRRAESAADLPLDLGRSLPEGRVARVVPAPLSLGALHHVIRRHVGSAPARPTLARIAAASAGNPFVAVEIARMLAQGGGEHGLADPLPLPRRLRELATQRVRVLPESAQELVLVAAALSRPTAAALAAALAPDVDAGPALRDAEEAGVLVSERGRIRFAHPLLASAVYASASGERRRSVHRRLAEIVGHPEERARHLAQCTTEPDEPTARELEQSARKAALRGAQDAAAELYEAARRLTPDGRPDDLARRLVGEARALLAVDDIAGARSRTESALSASPASPILSEALSLLGGVEWAGGRVRRALECRERALAAAAGDAEREGRISMELARLNVLLAPRRAMVNADAAIALLSEEREPELLAYALIDRFWAEALVGGGARRDLLERGLELERRATLRLGLHPIPLIWFHCVDEFDAARTRHAAEDEWLRDHGEEAMRQDRLAHLALVELRAGRWDLGEQHIDASCAAVDQAEAGGPRAMRFAFRSLVDAHRGRVERARRILLPLIEAVERAEATYWTALALSVLAVVEFAAADHAAVDRTLTRMRERLETIGIEDALLDRSEPFHVESLLALGELDRAREILARLEERGRILPRPWIEATLPRAHALVLAAEGDVAGALDRLDVREGPLPFEHAWTLLVKGRLHRRAKQKRAAAEALREALERFERLGAPGWAERTRSELERVGLRRRSPVELTASERRVAELAAGGMTNREVATAAFMSPKTVEANLARVYRKLGIRSRAELGARMAGET